jgi:hypothetical protein
MRYLFCATAAVPEFACPAGALIDVLIGGDPAILVSWQLVTGETFVHKVPPNYGLVLRLTEEGGLRWLNAPLSVLSRAAVAHDRRARRLQPLQAAARQQA